MKRAGLQVKIDWVEGYCPVQAEGHITVDDVAYPFFLRSRGDRIQIWIARAPNEDPLSMSSVYYERHHFKRFPWAGYITDGKARTFISTWARRFANAQRGRPRGRRGRPRRRTHAA